MKVQDVRYHNLQVLLDEVGGNQAELARRAGTNPAYINQIMNQLPLSSGRPRGIGERLARNLERALSKPEGWMDCLQNPYKVAEAPASYQTESPSMQRLMVAARRLNNEELLLVCRMVEGLAGSRY